MSDGKRRLPVIDSRRPGPDEGRPAWQWIGIGVGLILMFWMPLAYVAQIMARGYWASRLGETDPARVAEAYERLEGGGRLELQATLALTAGVAFVVAATIGGVVVGRFDERSGARNATIAGALVAGLAAVLAALSSVGVASLGGLLVAAVSMGLLGAGAARLGAFLGRPKEDA